MSISIGKTDNKYNTSITDITLDGIKYKYYCNKVDNLQFITSSDQTQEIIDYINIVLSNNNSCEYNINWDDINIIIKKYKLSTDINKIIIEDKYNIFNITTNTKYKHNQNILLNNLLTKYQTKRKIPDNIPKDLFLNNKQLAHVIMSEINIINTNNVYPHYIVCNNNDLMNLSIRFVYNKNNLGDIMEKFNNKHGYNYFEINMKLSELHPFLPPIISYVKPKIDTKLVSSILGLDIWKASSWNYSITLEWIVINLANALEEHFINYLDIEDKPFDFIEIKMLELQRTNNVENNIPIDLKFNKLINDNLKHNTGFKVGTGYGNGNEQKWDITKYIDINKANEESSINILIELNNYIKTNTNIVIVDNFYNYIISKFTGINLLVFNNNIKLYKVLIETLDLLINTNTNIHRCIIINELSTEIVEEIKLIISNDASINIAINIEEIYIFTYLHFIDVIEKLSKKYEINNKAINKQNESSNDEKEKYIKMVKANNYGTIKLDSSHRFYNERKHMISPKTIVRIMGELSSLKKDLPINWDSSVVMRIIPTNTNLLSFIISGPKDTPYHNGLFEFHAYFPDNYPSTVPQVLINTTGGGRVRFNPNLYENGKVCLSLLGTWRGEKGESWIPEISTFFQVIISIQSLILVDEPYFNEPGYESSSNTPSGKKQSANYNDNIRYETMRVAMLGMLKNKLNGYEKFIEEHFKFKKNEIIEVLNKWYTETNNKDKFKKIFDELVEELNKL